MTAGKWKVKRVKGESLKHKIVKERNFRNFNKIEKSAMLLGVIFLGFFAVTYGYWAINVANQPKPDPFTTLYAGQSGPVYIPTYKSSNNFVGCDPLDAGCSIGSISVVKNDLIVIHSYIEATSGSNIGFSDSQSNSYTQILSFTAGGEPSVNEQIFAATASSTATITITQNAFNAWTMFVDTIVSGVLSVDTTVVDKGLAQASSTTTTAYFKNGIVLDSEVVSNQVNLTCPSLATTGTYQSGCDTDTGFGYSFVQGKVRGDSTSHTIADGTAIGGYFVHATILLRGSPSSCIEGYQCINAHGDTLGNLVMASNATVAAVALSDSAITLANCVSLACAWSEFAATQEVSGTSLAWFMRLNATLPTEPNWSPLNDHSTAIVVVATMHGSNVTDYTVYIQRQPGQELNASSTTPAVPTCSQSSTIYLCYHSTSWTTNQLTEGLVLNFTGGSNGNGSTGDSYLCPSENAGAFTCNLGGVNDVTIGFTGTTQVQNFTLPWLNLQNAYHLGFWENAGKCGGFNCGVFPQTFFTSTGSLGGTGNNVISVYVPVSVGTQDSGSYAGYTSQTLIGAGCYVASQLITLGLIDICKSVSNAVSDAPQTLGTPFIQALLFVFGVVVSTFEITLNAIGNALGLGNIGTLLITTLQAIGSLIVNGFSAIISFFTAIGSLISSGYFTFLAGAAVLIGTLLPIAIGLWLIIFNGAFTVTDIMFFDYVVGIFMVFHAIEKKQSSLKAFLSWIQINIFIFTFVLNAAWVIFDIVTRPIHRTKETVDPVG